jgi:four helix bundle protein
VEEAQGSQSRADFIAKSYIACKEARETLYWLRVLAASKAVPQDRLAGLINEADQLTAILTSIVRNARANDEKRPKTANRVRIA